MNFSIETTAIALWLQSQIQQALAGQKDGVFPDRCALGKPVTVAVSLRLLDKKVTFSYSCAIARQWAALTHTSPNTVAGQLAESLADLSEIQVHLKDKGWMELDISDRAIAHWLQARFQHPLAPDPGWHNLNSASIDAERLFLWQYTHARCCSLLSASDRPIREPLAWQLSFSHPPERRLIYRILEIHDLLSLPPGKQPERLAQKLLQSLSEDVLAFEKTCQLWGLVKTQKLEQASLRLGLIRLSQWLLETLLSPILGQFAPLNLE